MNVIGDLASSVKASTIRPLKQVESYSQLMRDFANEDSFIACGEEMLPLELSSRRPSPVSDARGFIRLPNKNLVCKYLQVSGNT